MLLESEDGDGLSAIMKVGGEGRRLLEGWVDVFDSGSETIGNMHLEDERHLSGAEMGRSEECCSDIGLIQPVPAAMILSVCLSARAT